MYKQVPFIATLDYRRMTFCCFKVHTLVPRNFVWGSCFWFSIPSLRLRLPPRLLPTIFHMLLVTHNLSYVAYHTPSFTHNFVTHTHLCQPPSFTHHLSHTHLCQPPSFTHHRSHTISHTPSRTRIFVNHHLSHTIFLHTPSFTHHLCQPSLSTTIFHTPSFTHHLSHTSLSTTIFHTPSFTHHLLHTHTHHLSHTISHTPSTFVSRGRCGTWRHPPPLCVAGVALMALGWLWWRPSAPFGRRWRRGTLRGRRGTWRHPPSFHVAGVALGDMNLPFAWQAWH